MKTLRSLIYTLIRINIVVAILCLLFVIVTRQHQAQMAAELQKSPYKSEPFKGEINAKLADEQHQLLASQLLYEQRIKKLEKQLKTAPNYQIYPLQTKSVPSNIVPSPTPSSTLPTNPSQTIPFSSPLSQPHSVFPQPRNYSVNPRGNNPVKPVNSTPLLLASPSPVLPKPENHISPEEKANISDNDNQSKPKEPIASANLSQTQPETSISPTSDNKSLEKKPLPEETKINHSRQTEKISNNKPKNTQKSINFNNSTSYAKDITTGLIVAQSKGQIKYGTTMYKQVQTAIFLLRHGISKEEAIRKSKVPSETLTQLIQWGENYPEVPGVKLLVKEKQPTPEGTKITSSQHMDKISNKKLKNAEESINFNNSTSYAKDITTGLIVAQSKGQIKYGTTMYKQVQTAIFLLRHGASKEEAMRKSKVPQDILAQLINWGAKSPGRLNNPVDNSEVSQNSQNNFQP